METLLALPWWYLALNAFVFGVIIGSFLNVFIYRFHTGKSLSGASHCLSCQTGLRWYELFPLVSYLGLRGRCRTCSALIPSRYFWVELLTGLLFVFVTVTQPYTLWVPSMILMATLVVVSVYDIYHLVIPQVFVWVLTILAVLLYLVMYLVLPYPLINLLYAVVAGVIGYGFFALLWKFSDGRWVGYGDAKLAAPLAAIVGWSGVFSMLVASFWIGTVISLSLMLVWRLRRRRGQFHLRFLSEPLTMKSEVPFAPFLILGFLAVYLFQLDVLVLMSYVLPQ